MAASADRRPRSGGGRRPDFAGEWKRELGGSRELVTLARIQAAADARQWDRERAERTRRRDLAYQRAALGGVSRTFALTIPELPEGLRDAVGNAYLLCRIADCIEDEPTLTARRKRRFGDRFVDVVAGRGSSAAFGSDLARELSSSTSAERDLVANTLRVIRITRGLRRKQRQAIARCVRIMMAGMSEFQQTDTSAGLRDVQQLRRYCYVVAGVVVLRPLAGDQETAGESAAAGGVVRPGPPDDEHPQGRLGGP